MIRDLITWLLRRPAPPSPPPPPAAYLTMDARKRVAILGLPGACAGGVLLLFNAGGEVLAEGDLDDASWTIVDGVASCTVPLTRTSWWDGTAPTSYHVVASDYELLVAGPLPRRPGELGLDHATPPASLTFSVTLR